MDLLDFNSHTWFLEKKKQKFLTIPILVILSYPNTQVIKQYTKDKYTKFWQIKKMNDKKQEVISYLQLSQSDTLLLF